MTVLIADDDKLARYNLKSMLCDLDSDGFILYEAANGKTFVEQCRRLHPDIAFVDITMPHLDGLSAIEQCREYTRDTQFVILSGHSEFGYAKRGIELQIADYIVKPIDAVQLAELMDRLRDRLAHTRKTRNMDFYMWVHQCFQIWEEAGYCEMPGPGPDCGGSYYGFRFFLDAGPGAGGYPAAYLALSEGLYAVGRGCLDRRIHYALRESRDTGLDFIVCCTAGELPPLRRRIRDLCRALEGDGMAVSCLYVAGVDLWQLYEELKAVAERDYLRFGAPDSACAFHELMFTAGEQNVLAQADALIEYFQQADENRYLRAVSALKELGKEPLPQLNTGALTRALGICLGGAFAWKDLPELCRALERHKSHIFDGAQSSGTDKMSYATEYVEKHYMQDISVVQLAEKLQLTPNYFSKVFHERTGQTFSAYLTNVRMGQAKRILLSRRDVLVKDVALMVGYYSSRHFANVFKKFTGLYPSEFRENN